MQREGPGEPPLHWEQIRTSLYGDQWLVPQELQVMHTRAFQRLYDMKQLGWADRVYPDAVHSRFNHSLGVLERANAITDWVVRNCRSEGKPELAESAESNRQAIRFTALLHDVFHIPYGHTLEEELHLLPRRHDEDEERKVRILDRVLAETMYWTCDSTFGLAPVGVTEDGFWAAYATGVDLHEIVHRMYEHLTRDLDSVADSFGDVGAFVRNYAKATEALLYMGNETIYVRAGGDFVWSRGEPLAQKLLGTGRPQFDPFSEFYICDIIGNTISADLLDYGRRDPRLCGLKLDYDDRILQYFTLVRFPERVRVARDVDGGAPRPPEEEHERVRVAINVVRRRVRYDAVSEILQVLKIRYLLTERVLYHRTKCAAGAMLGRALELIIPTQEQRETIAQHGDLELLRRLEDLAEEQSRNGAQREQALGALRLVRALRSRRFYKPVFHVRAIPGSPPSDPGHPATVLENADFRSLLEEAIESQLGLTPGSVVIYCPGKTALKEAECLVVYDRFGAVRPLSQVPGEGELGSFVREAADIADKYNLLWNLYVFCPERLLVAWPLIEYLLPRLFQGLVREKGWDPERYQDMQNDSYLRTYLREQASIHPWGREFEQRVQEVARRHGWDTVLEDLKETEQEALVAAERGGQLELATDTYGMRLVHRLEARLRAADTEGKPL